MYQVAATDQTHTVGEQDLVGSVTSRDGTNIGYRRLGRGPGVVILHGAMESAQSHLQLAEALAGDYTVYLPDRRGRGLSGAYGDEHSIQRDVEDMDAVLTKTGARYGLGVSSGAIIWLHAALALPAISKAAIFEPPLVSSGPSVSAWLPAFDGDIAEGKVASALITAMKRAEMGPPIFKVLPGWLLEGLTRMAMASEDKRARPGDVTMRALAPTLHYDFQIVLESEGALDRFRAMPAEVLLLGGSKSPTYLKGSLDALEKVLPHATRVEFSGLAHGATGNTDRGGRPELVARELRRFFG